MSEIQSDSVVQDTRRFKPTPQSVIFWTISRKFFRSRPLAFLDAQSFRIASTRRCVGILKQFVFSSIVRRILRCDVNFMCMTKRQFEILIFYDHAMIQEYSYIDCK